MKQHFVLASVMVDATRWHKNGDHPRDYQKTVQGYSGGYLTDFAPEFQRDNDWEGQVVRRFRHPYIDGDKLCTECGRKAHDHGWIDDGGHGMRVCPGDWIITSKDGKQFFPMRDRMFRVLFVEPH